MRHKNSIQAKLPLHAAAEAVPLPINWRRRQRDRGAMLLAVLFMMAMMVIFAMAMAPSFVQQMKRDREEEMVHRGTEYARAVKKFYKKFGRYPTSLEQLDNTNQIRFLRRRFKDPLTKDGEWKLLHYGDIQTITGGAAVGTPAALLGGQGAAQGLGSPLNQGARGLANGQGAMSALTGAMPTQPVVLGQSDQTPSSVQTSGTASPFITQDAGTTGQTGANQGNNLGGTPNPGTANQPGNNNTIFGNSGVGGQTFGGGAIVGVASKDKDPTIRIFNKKKTYDEWMFIYNPAMDLVNVLLRGPYNGQTYGGAQVGTPAGQLNQTNQGAAGQQPGGITQQPGGFGQQPPQQNQPAPPGGQFPPDQNQTPQ